MAEPETTIPVVFGRSSKKRKNYRQRGAEAATADDRPAAANSPRTDDVDEARQTTPAQTRPVESRASIDRIGGIKDDRGDDDIKADGYGVGIGEEAEDAGDDGDDGDDDVVGIAVAELIRRRKQRKPKIGGVEFRNDTDEGAGARLSSERSLVPSGDFDPEDMDLDFSSEALPMGERFAPQTGLIGELVNKHMEEYVEAQMAKRRQADAAQARQGSTSGRGTMTGQASGTTSSGGGGGLGTEAREQLAMKGKLHEIDLGAEARARNIAMTAQATQRLRSTGQPESDAGAPGDRVRPGRDGKPSQRERRGSDDLKRDQLVEQFLHENKMDVDVYDVKPDALTGSEGRPTDDRIAEQFRREFMEAVAQRMRRKRRPLGPPAKPKTRNEEEILRGPKLGGSRNVRSAMRDKLLQKQEEARQSMPKYELQLQEQKRRANRRR